MSTQIALVQKREASDNVVPISKLLQQFLSEHLADEVCLRDLLNEMENRAFASSMLICALPVALPLPTFGISAVVAMPLLLVSGQLILGFEKPWLPEWILDHPFKQEHFEMVISAAIVFIEKLEYFVEPRWTLFTSPEAERCVGVILLFLSFIIALPIPFGNMLPAIVIVLICLGLIEKDGLIIAINGIVAGVTPALLLLIL